MKQHFAVVGLLKFQGSRGVQGWFAWVLEGDICLFGAYWGLGFGLVYFLFLFQILKLKGRMEIKLFVRVPDFIKKIKK